MQDGITIFLMTNRRIAFEEDHRNVEDAEVFDFNAYDEAYKMEEIARNLILSRCARPTEDLRMIRRAGFCEATVRQGGLEKKSGMM